MKVNHCDVMKENHSLRIMMRRQYLNSLFGPPDVSWKVIDEFSSVRKKLSYGDFRCSAKFFWMKSSSSFHVAGNEDEEM